IIVVLIVVLGTFGFRAWAMLQQTATKNELAAGYNQHPLMSPFRLVSQSWQPDTAFLSSSGKWQYTYAAGITGPAARTAANNDLAPSLGYQVVATSPDVISPVSATLYRDLITGDDSVRVDIIPANGDSYAKGPVAVTVTLTPLTGQ
ncbi:MAG TPA: hypothetical protein VMS08_01920, partial [Candidatus Saccharimonadia bacterium]|nr:hypothetical protein [Candidatus Saccharimonadia bacterium]